jgi:Bacterial regulatory proteins, luxR family
MSKRWPTGRDAPRASRNESPRSSALISQGRTNAEIAALMYPSENTVKSYIRQLYRKIGVTSRTQAVLWASRSAFLPDHHLWIEGEDLGVMCGTERFLTSKPSGKRPGWEDPR